MKFNERKMKIIDTAHQLFVKNGFHTTSIQDIIEKANISKGTFYNYFASKNECLLAILENVQAEGNQKRMELALGKDRRDEEVFIKQIAVRSNMNRKYSMLVLFEAITHLDDPEIKTFLKKQYQIEIKWTAKRISEIYRPEVQAYSLDQAVMLIGMIHHFMHTWKMEIEEDIEAERVVRFLLNRMKPMIQDQIETGERFFTKNWFDTESDDTQQNELKELLVEKIDTIADQLDFNQKKYLLFLKEEIASEKPRDFLIESIVLSLKHQFENSKMWHEVRHMIQLVKTYVDTIGQESGV